ncbi:MAG TPA: hypothetical protein VL337_11800 [Acidimicrobiales bacterium]|jgi:hypothetical protein|nr:hypothetical protein [Acidimicrobiales bacterium]
MRIRALGAILLVTLVTLVGCGSGGTRSVSTQQAAPGAANVDATAVTARWRVVKIAAGETHLKVGDIVEFQPGGTVASGPNLATSTATWAMAGNRFELRDGGAAVSYAPALVGDVLTLVNASGQSNVLRRYQGQPTPPIPANSALEEAQFLSLVARGRVESATLTQSGSVIAVTGVYDGDQGAERYAVTLTDCKRAQGLDALFRSQGVLTDGLPPAAVQC